ncbi:transcription termination factor 4, mitochondrial [Phaenicophaeus curvirostris]|uniref:transcription termination factor 4, mitochondrial n=1 Tax=Phaenicophaeus curvirostris TaxID=33595 RepID=UPI0037F0CBA5
MAALLLRGGVRAAGRAAGSVRCCAEAAAALRALGFSEEQARRLRELQPRRDAPRRREAAAELLLLGLSPAAALRVLERSPELLRDPAGRLRQRAAELRRLGLHGGRLERALSRCPQLLSVPGRQLAAWERVLRERCLLTAEQLREVLASSPAALLEEPHSIHRHFQYAYFRMGTRQKEMVKARLFQMPFAELRNRHVFLERRGLFQTPHKGQTQTDNPKLKDIIQLSEKDFLASVARSTPEEYEVFKKLLAREEEEEEEEEDKDALDAEEDDDWDSEGSQTARE